MGPMELLQLQYKGSVLLSALRVRKGRCVYESGKFMPKNFFYVVNVFRLMNSDIKTFFKSLLK